MLDRREINALKIANRGQSWHYKQDTFVRLIQYLFFKRTKSPALLAQTFSKTERNNG